MKIKVECKCGELLEIELNDIFEVIDVEYLNDNITEISSEERKELMNKSGIEFG